MTKVLFKTFIEACEFSKNIALTMKTTSAIHREDDLWWVDNLQVEQIVVTRNKYINKEEKPLVIEQFDYDENKIKNSNVDDKRNDILKKVRSGALSKGRIELVLLNKVELCLTQDNIAEIKEYYDKSEYQVSITSNDIVGPIVNHGTI